MRMYAVYDRPSDYPKEVVVRGFTIGKGVVIPDEKLFLKDKDIAAVFREMATLNMVFVSCDPHDDENIIGVYL